MIFYSRQPSPDRIVPSNADNNSGWAWASLFVSFSIAALMVVARISVKKKAYALDDVFLIFAYAAGLVVWVCWVMSLAYGLGRSFNVLDDRGISNTQLYLFLSYVFFNIPIALSKISILMLFKGIFTTAVVLQHIALGTIGLTAVWGVTSSFVVLFSCSRATLLPNAGAEYCTDSKIGFTIIVAFECFIELIVMFLPFYGCWHTMHPWGLMAAVAWLFLVRSLNIVCSVMHMRLYFKFMHEHEPAIDIIPTFIWAVALLTYNLISATLPLLKEFTQQFASQGSAFVNSDSRAKVTAKPSGKYFSLRLSRMRRPYSPSVRSQASQQRII